jgi:hypothetical protein
MRGDWRDYRPAIWLAMLGIALALVFDPPYVGAVLIGASIGVALKTARQRRSAAAAPARPSRRARGPGRR